MIKQVSKKAIGLLAIFVAILVGSTSLMAQNRAVSGTVVDEEGVPVIGAAVVLVGNNTVGTMTDVDGAFSLNVPANASLQVSCIGYASQVVAVGNQTKLNIVLVADSEFLEETVVIGYGVQKKSDLTGAVASLRAEDLKNVSTTDAAAALKGKVSGVHILSDGAPGSGATIRVRGYSSNSGNISPLLIVDGLQVSSIQYLDPSLIESMEVLKDGASAAIYGAEAGNGVVLITTKSGSTGKTSVSYTGKSTLQNFHRRVNLRRDDFIDYMNMKMGAETTANQIAAFDYKHPLYEGGVIDQDWLDAYIEPTWSQQHSLNFSGGNNAGHFFASVNYVYNDGIVRGDKDVYKRLTAQVNADYQIFKWLQVGVNNSIEKWSTKSVSQRGYGSSFESLLMIDPLTPVYWTDPSQFSSNVKAKYDAVQAGDPSVRPYRFFGDENGWFANSKYSDLEGSPFAKRDASEGTNGGFNINGTAFLNLTPIKGLTFTSRLGYRLVMSSSHSYQAPYYIGDRGSNDNFSISASANTSWYYQWENFANYILNIGKHSITAMAGMSYRENNSDNVNVSANGADILSSYEPNFLYVNYIKNDVPKSVGNAPSRSASLAYFGRLIYSYDNRYSVQANFRADAFDTSKLSADKRWGYFPSVSAGWTISNESFIKDNISRDALSFLKLRASWGINGNISVLSGYRYVSTIALANNWYQYGVDTPGSVYSSSPNGIANKDLTWEKSEQLDLGLDARFLNDRLTVGMDYFDKKTRDLLFNVPISPEYGYDSATKNGGTVLNRGFELEATWKDSIGDFRYSIGANFSALKNKVLALAKNASPIRNTDASSTNLTVQSVFEPGMPVWYIRGYHYLGVNADGSANIQNTDGSVNENGEPTVGDEDMIFLGSSTPTSTFGLNINLEYKGIDLMIYGAGAAGNVIMPVTHRTGFKNELKVYYDKFKSGEYPDANAVAGDMQFWSSDANIFKGDYFRIKQLQLGYTIPRNITKKAAISNLRLYVSLDDYFTFTKYPGLDPETASTNNTSGAGLDWGSYPTMQKVLFGVNVTF